MPLPAREPWGAAGPYPLRRWLPAMLGGLLYAGLHAAIEFAFPDHWSGSGATLLGLTYTEVSRTLWLPSALLLTGLTSVYRQLSDSLGLWGQIGYLFGALGFGLDILGGLIEFWICGLEWFPALGRFYTGSACSNVGYSIASIGSLLLILGLLLLGLTGLRSPIRTPWRAALFAGGLSYAAALPLFFLGARWIVLHALAFGITWIWIGTLLREKNKNAPSK